MKLGESLEKPEERNLPEINLLRYCFQMRIKDPGHTIIESFELEEISEGPIPFLDAHLLLTFPIDFRDSSAKPF